MTTHSLTLYTIHETIQPKPGSVTNYNMTTHSLTLYTIHKTIQPKPGGLGWMVLCMVYRVNE
jgi:hypothetical protein